MAEDERQELIRISPEEVAAAVVPPPRPVRPAGVALPVERPPGISQLAIASLVLAIIGIPLVGCLLGPIAIVCGVIALGGAERSGESWGTRVAVAGTVVGILETLGWGVAIWLLAARPSVLAPVPAPFPALRAPLDISAAPEHIRQALRANVRVVCEQGGAVGSGAGVVLRAGNARTLVLTNRHVVECAAAGASGKLRVAAGAGEEAPAVLRWEAAEGIDLAVVEVGRALEVAEIPLRRGRGARIGDPVFAVGNPLGFDATYTVGTLSAVRAMEVGGRSLRIYQVQASVNRGNSGGGLYDASGELIGINTWTAEKSVSEGLGFSIAIEVAISSLESSGESWARELVRGAEAPEEKGSP